MPAQIIPKSGMIVPEMGRTAKIAPRTNLAGALFTSVQQRVLGLLFGQPDRRFQSAELIRLAKGGTGATHRQLERLQAVGLVTVTHAGNQKHYQANRNVPIFPELHGLIVKTVGIAEPLRRALAPHEDQIRAAFVYGSIAKGMDTARSDIDLMVVSDGLRYSEIFDAIQTAEADLARPVNPTVVTIAEWRAKRSRRGSFISKVAAQPSIFVIGSNDDLA